MGLFSWIKKKEFFSEEEKQFIAEAIRNAERRTSGEIRVFVESKCSFVDPLDRALEIFTRLKMDQTSERNAVLIYVAVKDRQLAIYGEEGIHQKVGKEFWNKEVARMIHAFNQNNYAEGIKQCVTEVGEALCKHFPYNASTDKNELPDDIVFGK
ncbi:MAG: TPM domain-containing protein [Bacteroidota bacterium]|nr:TPM domain-containing protein [Bacteroidota bacterium]